MVLREVHDEGHAVPAGGVLTLELKSFDAGEAQKIESWFDDPKTQAWLGTRSWISNIFRLQREPGGVPRSPQHRLPRFTGYVDSVGVGATGLPVGFVDAAVVDRYVHYGGESDGQPVYLAVEPVVSASLSVVVDPALRRQGYASALVKALIGNPALGAVRPIRGRSGARQPRKHPNP